MKIVHVTAHCLFLGGGERLGYNWITNSKHESLYYAKEGGIDYDKSAKFITYKDDAEFREIILRHKDDVIVSHDPFITEHELFSQCKHLIWYVHGAFPFGWDISSHASPKFAISNYMPKVRHSSWNSIPIIPVQLGIDMEQFQPPMKSPRSSKLLVAIVGRISEEKIPLYFFDFIKQFNNKHFGLTSYEFQFFGKRAVGSLYDQAFMEHVASTPNARYMGEVDKSDIQSVYQSADVLVVPSLSETGSYAIVEAQACGLRVLCLDADGMPNHVVGRSKLCTNYDDIFRTLGGLTRDKVRKRREQAQLTRERHSLGTWVQKLDKLAEIAFLD